MGITEAINILEVVKYCDVDEIAKINAIDVAICALKEKQDRNYNPKLTLEDLQALNGKCIWWDNFGGEWCVCREGYVALEYGGTFSFDFVLSNGSAYRRKPDSTT